jgi:hypothetical protein
LVPFVVCSSGDDEQGGDLGSALQKLSDAAASVQDAAIKVVEVKFNRVPSKSAAASDDDDQESNEAAEDKAAAAVAALEEALQAAVAAVAAVPAAAGSEGGVSKEGVRSEVDGEVDEAVAAVEEKTKGQQETALQVSKVLFSACGGGGGECRSCKARLCKSSRSPGLEFSCFIAGVHCESNPAWK